MANNVFDWQANVIPGNAVQGSILLTRTVLGEPPFTQEPFVWKPMEDIIGVANIKVEYDPITQTYTLSKAKGHLDNDNNWTYTWEVVGTWQQGGGGGGGGFTPTPAQLTAMNSGIDATKVAQIATNTNNINNKQNTLVSGTNIRTLANQSILGSGNLFSTETITVYGVNETTTFQALKV